MAKAKECTIIFNTKWGYCMTPVKCASIREALRRAKETGMAYRICIDGECIRNGWFQEKD